nr:hypothetical protein [Tanacetum cinerariifolium]
KERVKYLEDKEEVIRVQSGDDAPIKGRRSNEGEGAAERISTDSEEIARVLTSLDATNVLAGESNVPTGSEEQQEREDLRMNEQIARDAEVAMIYAEEEIQAMIDSLDKSNETVAKYLQEYQQFASDLSLEKKIELISDLVKYQDHYKKEVAERAKRQVIILEKEQVKKQKLSEEAPESISPTEEVRDDRIKEMMQLVPVEDVKYEPDPEDQLWTLTQNYMHAPVEWKLYDLSGVHHVTAKDKEIFMLVEKDYPLRRGLALVMI